ncbi:DMT family transporter [Methylobacterium radiodurans]|uniref:EamA family transporter n=1 Tax=Methylobacterium radiodurans TaxID=2202828 RepID=A0A2U8VY66_9HYPH|nr:DMT family transporter [Methylobacterium radiodurans]AWN38212.1 EamA family transporter [Methylobacterium radiodurans]
MANPILAAPVSARPVPAAGALRDGLVGVAIFGGTLTATRLALASFEPVALTLIRAALAGLAAGAVLAALRQPTPRRADLAALAVVSFGVVLGFPLFTAFALGQIGAGRASVFVGLLPLATSIFGALRAGERPSRAFWLLSGLGSAVTAAFAARGAGPGSLLGDGLMLAAILVCGLGYAEGARLARRLGGWQVVAWATVLALPATLPAALWLIPEHARAVTPAALAGLAYVAALSSLVGFVFWYRALARGGIAVTGQLQLLQPFLGMALAALVLGEAIDPLMPLVAAAVAACAAGARRLA